MSYYTPQPILQKGEDIKCPVLIVAGAKGNGKTYGFILHFLKIFIKTDRYLRYVRRYRDSISPRAIMSLLKPHTQNIINLTNGEYNDYKYYRSRFYLTRVENGKVVKTQKQPFIVCSALNSVESYTGADEGDCGGMLFDEFLSREKSLPDEFTSLMILHSNCVRNRADNYTPLILIGNTFTRNSPLARDFGVNLYKLQKDSVTIFSNRDGAPTAIVERCGDLDILDTSGDVYYNRYNDGRINLVTNGDWTIANYPRLKERYILSSSILLTMLCVYEDNITLSLRKYKSFIFVYVDYACDNDYNIVITTKDTPLQPFVINYYPNNIPIFKTIARLIQRKHIYFASGEVGEMFRDFLLNLKGAEKLGGLFK